MSSERDATFYAQGGWGYDEAQVFERCRKLVANFALEGRTLLDAGCGDGVYTEGFRRAGADTVGVDVSLDAIQTAEARYPDNTFVLADLENWAVGTYDVVWCRGISHTGHPRDDASDRVFANLRKSLAADGLLLLERVTDGSGIDGPSAYIPGQLRGNPTAGELLSLVDAFFSLHAVVKSPDSLLLVCT